MQIELLAILVIGLIALFAFAERAKSNRIMGVFAALMLILLGLWIAYDHIQVYTGTNASFTSSTNITTNITTTVANITETYSPVTTPLANFDDVATLGSILLGIYLLLHYGLLSAESK
jgi:uncharacterized membrane protein